MVSSLGSFLLQEYLIFLGQFLLQEYRIFLRQFLLQEYLIFLRQFLLQEYRIFPLGLSEMDFKSYTKIHSSFPTSIL